MQKILILGPQGSGKGTQAEILSKTLGVPTFSMGQLLREAAQQGGPMGEKIAAIQNAGDLVPFEVSIAVLHAKLVKEHAREGYIIDGFPRNVDQFKSFDAYDQPTCVIVLEVPRHVSLERLSKRANIESRADDTPEVIAHRLDLHERDTTQVIAEYERRGIVHRVNGEGSVEEVATAIKKICV